jgi:hypothetical protein
MKRSINRFEFYILLESYIEDLEFNSPLIEFILSAPLEKFDKFDIEREREELKIVLSGEDLKLFERIVRILSDPEFEFIISFRIDKKQFINKLYERDQLIVEYLFDAKDQFSLESPLPHDEKLSHYIKLLDISEYQLDYTQSQHILSYDEYVVLNLAFSLEKLSRSIGIVGDDTFIHFDLKDILNEFEERDHEFINDIAVLFRNEKGARESVDIPAQVDSLIKKEYLKKINGDSLTIGFKAVMLFENLFMPESIHFSYSNKKFINSDEVLFKYGMFQCNRKSSFLLYFENGNVIIKIIPDKGTFKKVFLKAFDF